MLLETYAQKYLFGYLFLVLLVRNGISALYGNFMFNFGRAMELFSSVSVPTLDCTSNVQVLTFFTSLPIIVVFLFSIKAILVTVK